MYIYIPTHKSVRSYSLKQIKNGHLLRALVVLLKRLSVILRLRWQPFIKTVFSSTLQLIVRSLETFL